MKQYVTPYSAEVAAQMKTFYNSLSVPQRRGYAALESEKLGYGGKAYIIRVLGISRDTLCQGIAELRYPEKYAPLPAGRQRRAGGGRKKKAQ